MQEQVLKALPHILDVNALAFLANSAGKLEKNRRSTANAGGSKKTQIDRFGAGNFWAEYVQACTRELERSLGERRAFSVRKEESSEDSHPLPAEVEEKLRMTGSAEEPVDWRSFGVLVNAISGQQQTLLESVGKQKGLEILGTFYRAQAAVIQAAGDTSLSNSFENRAGSLSENNRETDDSSHSRRCHDVPTAFSVQMTPHVLCHILQGFARYGSVVGSLNGDRIPFSKRDVVEVFRFLNPVCRRMFCCDTAAQNFGVDPHKLGIVLNSYAILYGNSLVQGGGIEGEGERKEEIDLIRDIFNTLAGSIWRQAGGDSENGEPPSSQESLQTQFQDRRIKASFETRIVDEITVASALNAQSKLELFAGHGTSGLQSSKPSFLYSAAKKMDFESAGNPRCCTTSKLFASRFPGAALRLALRQKTAAKGSARRRSRVSCTRWGRALTCARVSTNLPRRCVSCSASFSSSRRSRRAGWSCGARGEGSERGGGGTTGVETADPGWCGRAPSGGRRGSW